jgi:zinc transport system ATP-binding protein
LEALKEPREVISIQGLWAGYEHQPVLEDVTLSVRERDFVGLIGPNGGGKTTLVKVLLGLLPPLRGTVRIMGLSVEEGRRYIGYVPQLVQFERDFPISVWDVVRMGRLGKRRLLKRYTARDEEIVAEALRDVDMLELGNRPIGEPEILLLDEPTSNIDPGVSTSIYELLRQLNERVTILMISHDMNVISSYVKSVGCLNRWLFYHGGQELSPEMLEAAYQCPVDLIAHGVPHRVFAEHIHQGEAAP